MSKKSTLSDEIRRLEELRDEGFLGEKQFVREVRELTRRHEHERVDEGVPPVPADMVAHSEPVEYDPSGADLPQTPRLELEDEDADAAPRPYPDDEDADDDGEDFPERGAPGDGQHSGEAGRVIIRGKSPWDDRDEGRVSLQAPRAEKPSAEAVFDKEKKASDIKKREQIARMAEKSNRIMRRKKNPDAALVLSLAWPGLGNMYVGQVGSGMLGMLVGGACWVAAVGFGQWDLVWVALPMGLLMGAVARKKADLRNRSIDAMTDSKLRMQPKVSRLNVEKSLRATPPPNNPKGR